MIDTRNSYRVERIDFNPNYAVFSPQVRRFWWPFWVSISERFKFYNERTAKERCETHANYPKVSIIWTGRLP